jgi:hypothetical protein
VFKVHFVQLLGVPNMTKFQAILPKVLRVGKSSTAPLHIPKDTYVATNRAFVRNSISKDRNIFFRAVKRRTKCVLIM